MTDIKQLAKNLRRYNAWRRGAEGVEMPIPKDLSKWIEEAANALDCLTEPKPIKCETCEGAGKIDERLGGYHTSNANAQCPDCDGAGYLESVHDFRPGQWWVKELDGIQASQEATPDQKRAVAVVHNLLRHILKLERTERTACGRRGPQGCGMEGGVMTDDQLIESLRARTWPGDCEAAAFRLEELRARVAELEALPGNVLAQRVEVLEAALLEIADWTDLFARPGHPISKAARAAIAKSREIQSTEAGDSILGEQK